MKHLTEELTTLRNLPYTTIQEKYMWGRISRMVAVPVNIQVPREALKLALTDER